MKKHDDTLFQIGEITKILGVTRKTLLVYEDAGLLTPAVRDEESGYRYYSAENMTQIRAIRTLQSLGLSLKEVAEYYCDTKNMEKHLERLYELRALLDRNIQTLLVRTARHGDFTVRATTLPRQVCFCRRYVSDSVAEASDHLRETYLAAAHTGKMSTRSRMFTLRMDDDPGRLDLLCCIPIEESFQGEERQEFPETAALCVYHRGPYEEVPLAIRALADHIRERNIKTTGGFRSIYLEGPPDRGENSGDYITQIAVPVGEL